MFKICVDEQQKVQGRLVIGKMHCSMHGTCNKPEKRKGVPNKAHRKNSRDSIEHGGDLRSNGIGSCVEVKWTQLNLKQAIGERAT